MIISIKYFEINPSFDLFLLLTKTPVAAIPTELTTIANNIKSAASITIITKWFISEIKCSFTSYDLSMSASFYGDDCYNIYKAIQEFSIPTTIDVFFLYIADSIALVINKSLKYVSYSIDNVYQTSSNLGSCIIEGNNSMLVALTKLDLSQEILFL